MRSCKDVCVPSVRRSQIDHFPGCLGMSGLKRHRCSGLSDSVRAIRSVRHLMAVHDSAADPWLESACRCISVFAGPQTAVTLCLSPVCRKGQRPEAQSLGVYAPSRARVLRSHAAARWADDDISVPLELWSLSEGPRVYTGSSAVGARAWRDSRYARWRTKHQLHEFARAIVPVPTHRGTARVLIAQIDSFEPSWNLNDGQLELLGEITHTALEGLFRWVLEPEMRREAMLSRMTDIRRLLLPLLASGLTEREVARRVHRSENTVHEHTKAIYQELGVRSRLELRDRWLGLERNPGYSPPDR
jgi:hypothetical protein